MASDSVWTLWKALEIFDVLLPPRCLVFICKRCNVVTMLFGSVWKRVRYRLEPQLSGPPFDSKGKLTVDDRQCVPELCLNHLRPGSIRGSAAKRPRQDLRELAEANEAALQSAKTQSALRAAQVFTSASPWRPSSWSRAASTHLRRLGIAALNVCYLCTAQHQAITTAPIADSCAFFDCTQGLCADSDKQLAVFESECIAGDSTGAAAAAIAATEPPPVPFVMLGSGTCFCTCRHSVHLQC